MTQSAAQLVQTVLLGYLGVGLLFAIVFHIRWAPRLARHAQGASTGFRLVSTPGVVLLWPVLALRVFRG